MELNPPVAQQEMPRISPEYQIAFADFLEGNEGENLDLIRKAREGADDSQQAALLGIVQSLFEITVLSNKEKYGEKLTALVGERQKIGRENMSRELSKILFKE